jgi:hypothetical protein
MLFFERNTSAQHLVLPCAESNASVAYAVDDDIMIDWTTMQMHTDDESKAVEKEVFVRPRPAHVYKRQG